MYYIRNYAFYSSLSSYRPLRTSHNNKSFHLDHLLRSFPSLNQFLSHNPESVYLRDHSILKRRDKRNNKCITQEDSKTGTHIYNF
uniref:Uncharacterized protein n=1 Tax=Picea glauca TaxID=3330 RepID=A0A101M3E9_PICGL|nr:hypothetical protein ABT39_MTgene15 [Picea glauca]